jgi:hypothetical protein
MDREPETTGAEMTPAEEWLSSPDPGRLLELLGDRLTLERARMFAVGYCWLRAATFAPQAAELLELLEAIAFGTEPDSRLPEIRARLANQTWAGVALIRQAVIQEWRPPQPVWYMTRLQHLQNAVRELDRSAAIAHAASHAGPPPPDVHVNHPWHARFQSAFFEYIRPRADLMRCVFGNPFRPAAFDPMWRTSTVVSMARGMYDSRDFSAMPILADALQDAGCDSDDILAHCRGDSPHVRGCWIVDLCLDKS